MTHLRIENENNIPEIINSNIILKLYELIYDIDLNLEEGLLLLDYVSLKGNLLSNHGKQSALTYLNDKTKFPNLLISVPIGAEYIEFEDPEVERLLLGMNIGDGVGITPNNAAALTGLFTVSNSPFVNNTNITSFDELRYFGYTSFYSNTLDSGVFRGCTNLTSIDLSNITNVGKFSFNGCLNLENIGQFHGTVVDNFAFNRCSKLSFIDLSNVTTIGQCSFGGCTALTEIDLSSVTSIDGSSATNAPFINCTGLTTVTNLNKTGLYMFYGCTGLTTVGLTLNCTSIALNTFLGCTALTSIDLSNITSIGTSAFEGCTSLTSIDLSNVTSIGLFTFRYCNTLLTISTINLNLTSIPYGAFLGCSALTDTIDLTNVTSINGYAFGNNTNATFINLNNVLSVEELAFYNCPGLLGELHLQRINRIGGGAFHNTGITKLKISSSIGTIPGTGKESTYTFGACKNLTEVDLSECSITSIAGATFANDDNLTLIKLPSTLTSIGDWAFVCPISCALNRVYVIYATTPPTFANDAINCVRRSLGSSNNSNMGAIYVPDGYVQTYKEAAGWSYYANVIDSINNMPTT